MPCFIAGNQPTRQLKTAAGGMSNVTLLSDISSEEILQKIIQAQVNLLVTFQSTGIKLKLLNALHKGRFCVANRPMVAETGLESLCMVADDTEQLIKSTQSAWLSSFEEEALLHRQSLLDGGFSNRNNAVLIASYL
jgi:hypothetical protein